MNLYTISHEFELELSRFDDLLNPEWKQNEYGDYVTEDGEVITSAEYREMIEKRFEELNSIEQNVQRKALNIAAYIANTAAEIDAMKQREKTLAARRRAKENTVQSLKKYLIDCMEAAELRKIDSPELCITVRNNAESVEITDTEKFIVWAQNHGREELLKYSEPEIKKSAIKPLLKKGADIPYTTLTRTKSVLIK